MLTEAQLLKYGFYRINADVEQALYDRIIYPVVGNNVVRIHAAFNGDTVAESHTLTVLLLVADSAFKHDLANRITYGLTVITLFQGHPNAATPFFEALKTCFSLSAFMHELSIANQ